MPTPLTPEELTSVHAAGDRLEVLAEAADVATAEARRAKGELERLLRHLRIAHDVRDDRLGLDPVSGEWREPPQQQGQPAPSAPPPQRLPLLDAAGAATVAKLRRRGKRR